MKKIVFFLFFLIVPLFSYVHASYAEALPASKATTSEIKLGKQFRAVANVNILEGKLLSQEGNRFKLSFELSNGDLVQPDVKYGVRLIKNYDNAKSVLIDEFVYPEVLTMPAKQSLKKELEYTAPSYLNGEFEIWVSAANPSGLPLGLSYVARANLAGDENYIEILPGNCSLRIEGENDKVYALSQGVDVRKDETLIISCLIANHLGKDADVLPKFTTYYRSSFGKTAEVETRLQQPLRAAKDTVGQITAIVPKALKPQAYDAKLQLVDDKGSPVSNAVSAHYVIAGDSATIQNFRLDKESYKAGEVAKISLFLSGSAAVFSGSRLHYAEPDSIRVAVALNDAGGKSCAEQTAKEMKRNSDNVEFEMPIKGDCLDPVLHIALKNANDEVLDEKGFAMNIESEKKPLAEKSSSKRRLLYAASSIVVLVVFLLAFVFARRKKVLHLFVLSMAILALSPLSSARADTFVGRYSTSNLYYPQFGSHDVAIAYNLDKKVYSSGEQVYGSMQVIGLSCVNSIYDYTLFLGINGGVYERDYMNITVPHNYNNAAPAAAGIYDASFGFRDNRCYPMYGNCTYIEGMYLETLAGKFNSVSFQGRTDWDAASAQAFILSNGYGSVLNHFNTMGKVGCSVGPCMDIPGCKSACQAGTVSPWFSFTMPYEVQAAFLDGACGTRKSNYTSLDTDWPSGSTYCKDGNASASPAFPAPGASANWQCVGISGGATADCTATRDAATKIDGLCGDRDTTYSDAVTAWPALSEYCKDGSSPTSPPFPAVGSSVNWQCEGLNGGATVSCTAIRTSPGAVNGQCGSRNQIYATSTSAWPNGSSYCLQGANLSSPAFPANGSSVAWVCDGMNGGNAVNCSAATYDVFYMSDLYIRIDGKNFRAVGDSSGIAPLKVYKDGLAQSIALVSLGDQRESKARIKVGSTIMSLRNGYCGNGIVESPYSMEQCDDGNDVDSDGCTNECKCGIAWTVTEPAACPTACGTAAQTLYGTVTCSASCCNNDIKPAVPSTSCPATTECGVCAGGTVLPAGGIYDTPGVYSVTAPTNVSSVQFELWGAGAGGGGDGNAAAQGQNGGDTVLDASVIAGGGKAGSLTSINVAGGVASGGDVMTNGENGYGRSDCDHAGKGGSAANTTGTGGLGGSITTFHNGKNGLTPGGGGGGGYNNTINCAAGGGGGGAYVKKTYTGGSGAIYSFNVGAGGNGGNGDAIGGKGANGRVKVVFECN